jgi:hypothetical protein
VKKTRPAHTARQGCHHQPGSFRNDCGNDASL